MPLPCPGSPEIPAFPSLPLHTEASQRLQPGPELEFATSSITSSWEKRGGGGMGLGRGGGSAQGLESAERILTLVEPHPYPLLL